MVTVADKEWHATDRAQTHTLMRHYGMLFDVYRGKAPWFFLFELSFTITVNVINGLKASTGCDALAWLLAVIYTGVAALYMAFRPHSVRLDRVLYAGLALAQAAGSIFSAVSVALTRSHGEDAAATQHTRQAASLLLSAIGTSAGFVGLYEVAKALYAQYRRRRQKKDARKEAAKAPPPPLPSAAAVGTVDDDEEWLTALMGGEYDTCDTSPCHAVVVAEEEAPYHDGCQEAAASTSHVDAMSADACSSSSGGGSFQAAPIWGISLAQSSSLLADAPAGGDYGGDADDEAALLAASLRRRDELLLRLQRRPVAAAAAAEPIQQHWRRRSGSMAASAAAAVVPPSIWALVDAPPAAAAHYQLPLLGPRRQSPSARDRPLPPSPPPPPPMPRRPFAAAFRPQGRPSASALRSTHRTPALAWAQRRADAARHDAGGAETFRSLLHHRGGRVEDDDDDL